MRAIISISVRFHPNPALAEKLFVPSQTAHHLSDTTWGMPPVGWRELSASSSSQICGYIPILRFCPASRCGRLILKSTKRGTEQVKDQKKAETIASVRIQLLSPHLSEGQVSAKTREIKQRICNRAMSGPKTGCATEAWDHNFRKYRTDTKYASGRRNK